jgi:hypothetical protein
MQTRHLNAPRNTGRSASVSARALNVAGASLSGFFHYAAPRAQRIGTSSLPAPQGE